MKLLIDLEEALKIIADKLNSDGYNIIDVGITYDRENINGIPVTIKNIRFEASFKDEEVKDN
jgi:topoisomerase IA-like protein